MPPGVRGMPYCPHCRILGVFEVKGGELCPKPTGLAEKNTMDLLNAPVKTGWRMSQLHFRPLYHTRSSVIFEFSR